MTLSAVLRWALPQHRCSYVSLSLVLKKTWYLLGHPSQTWAAVCGSLNVKSLVFLYGCEKKGALFGGICTLLWDMKPYSQVSLSYNLKWIKTWPELPNCGYHVTEQVTSDRGRLILVLRQNEWLVLCSTCSDIGKGRNSLIQQWVRGAKRRTAYCTGSWVWPLLFLCEEHGTASGLAESKRGPGLLLLRWVESRRRIPDHWNLVWAAWSALFCILPAGNSLSEKYLSLLNVCLCQVENQSDLVSVHPAEEVSHISLLSRSYRTFHSISLKKRERSDYSILLPLISFSGLSLLWYISLMPGQFPSDQASICITDHIYWKGNWTLRGEVSFQPTRRLQ